MQWNKRFGIQQGVKQKLDSKSLVPLRYTRVWNDGLVASLPRAQHGGVPRNRLRLLGEGVSGTERVLAPPPVLWAYSPVASRQGRKYTPAAIAKL
jgi:hypothetical protein